MAIASCRRERRRFGVNGQGVIRRRVGALVPAVVDERRVVLNLNLLGGGGDDGGEGRGRGRRGARRGIICMHGAVEGLRDLWRFAAGAGERGSLGSHPRRHVVGSVGEGGAAVEASTFV